MEIIKKILESEKWFKRLWNLWPPFLGAGLKINYISSDWHQAQIILKKKFWNQNIMGTQFGGSIFAMTDAIYMVMLKKILGKNYIVWDKSASIQFLKPGKTQLKANFILTPEDIEGIRTQLTPENQKMDWRATVEVKDIQGQVIAVAERVVYIRAL